VFIVNISISNALLVRMDLFAVNTQSTVDRRRGPSSSADINSNTSMRSRTSTLYVATPILTMRPLYGDRSPAVARAKGSATILGNIFMSVVCHSVYTN